MAAAEILQQCKLSKLQDAQPKIAAICFVFYKEKKRIEKRIFYLNKR